MSSFLTSNFEALPNPRGAAVRAAENGLDEARQAVDSHAAPGAALLRVAKALGQAGWLPAQRYVDTLVLASPFADGELMPAFRAALDDFRAALMRRNLRELACSPVLFEHYRSLNAHLAVHTGASGVTYEEFALVGRPIAPAMLRAVAPTQLARLRACYEGALLGGLRGQVPAAGALDELDGYIAQLAGDDPYDVWRLVAGCARALRVAGRAASGAAEVKRFYARCNLLLAEQVRGLMFAPRSFVRAALALLWRDYALYGAAAEDVEEVALLNDYGLTVDWHVAATQDSEALWEADAARAEQTAVRDAAQVRELGVLALNVHAYEDFLQTADASMTTLASETGARAADATADAAGAMRASDAAYRLGAAGCALGLGHVAALADALGLAWRLSAHAWSADMPSRAPAPAAVEAGAEALRAMLLRVAAGVAPPESAGALSALTQAIERAGPAPTHRVS